MSFGFVVAVCAFLAASVHPAGDQRQHENSARQKEWDQVRAQLGEGAQVLKQNLAFLYAPFFSIAVFHQQRNQSTYLTQFTTDALAVISPGLAHAVAAMLQQGDAFSAECRYHFMGKPV